MTASNESKLSRRQPRLSIVLTNYNHARFLPRALNAVVHQSRAPDQLLLVDDGSADESVSIMDSYARDFPYVEVIRNRGNIGCTPSQNKALEFVRGDYVQRIASDDYMLPGFIEAVMRCASQNPDVGIVSTALALVANEKDDDGWGMVGVPEPNPSSVAWGFEGASRFYSPQDFRLLIETSEMKADASLSPSTIFSTEVVRKFGGWPTDLGMHEVSFILRAVGLHSGMAYVSQPLYTWVYRRKGITHTEQENIAQLRLDCVRQAQRMTDPPFDQLFSDAFRERWAADTMPSPPPPNWRKRLAQLLWARR